MIISHSQGGPSETGAFQWVACERYSSQSVSVTSIEVRGSAQATH